MSLLINGRVDVEKIVQDNYDDGFQTLMVFGKMSGSDVRIEETRKYPGDNWDVYHKIKFDGKYSDSEIYNKFLPLLSEKIERRVVSVNGENI